MEPSRTYSDPDAIARIADLTLRSRRLAEGAISGLHRSPFHGFNVEFAAYREYTPGDDLRRLDWRVFARSDRHFIKQYEEESNARVTFVVDASASMNYRGARATLTKFDYGATLTVALAMLLARQQDPVGLVLFDETANTVLPPSATQAQVAVLTAAAQPLAPVAAPEPAAQTEPGDQGVVWMRQPLARSAVLPGFTYKIKWPDSDHAIYITINDIEEQGRRRPFEIFINSKNMEHYAWTVALTRMISAVFRRGGDIAFVVEELKAVCDFYRLDKKGKKADLLVRIDEHIRKQRKA